MQIRPRIKNRIQFVNFLLIPILRQVFCFDIFVELQIEFFIIAIFEYKRFMLIGDKCFLQFNNINFGKLNEARRFIDFIFRRIFKQAV